MPIPLQHRAVKVGLVAVPEVSAAVIYGLHEVFECVGKTWERLTGEPSHARQMSVQIVAASTRSFRTALGVPMAAHCTFSDSENFDIVLVADLNIDDATDTRGRWPAAVQWLEHQYAHGAIVGSVCTGSLMLADAGLLNNLEATTHWSAVALFESRYPHVVLRPERVLSAAGPEHRIVTSGGSSSWADLAVYLIARFCGTDEARRMAKVFLIGDRSEGQLPFAAMARPKQHDDAVIAQCQAWIADNYALGNPVMRMAQHSGLSARTFKRRFSSATGYGPLDYVQTLRVEEAKQMLETDNDPIEQIALSVGYEDPKSFRRLFKRLAGISPARYRQRFRSIALSAALPM